MRQRHVITLLVVIALAAAAAHAQQTYTVQASVDPQSISLGEPTVLQLTIISQSSEFPDSLNLPDIPGFQAVGQPQASSQTFSQPGRIEYHRVIRWLIAPQREGLLHIPGLPIDLGGVTHTTNAMLINVMPSPMSDLTNGVRLADPVWALPTSRLAQVYPQRYQSDRQAFENNLYLLVCADKDHPRVGEQVNVSVYLINGATQIDEPTITRGWQISGAPYRELVRNAPQQQQPFFTQFDPLRQQDYTQVRDPLGGDRDVPARLIHRMAIFPTRAGPLVLGQLQATSHYQARDVRGLINVVLNTAPISIGVRPLPGSQTGLADVPVGRQFRLSANLTPTELSYDEAATLTVRIEGVGWPDLFEAPEIDGGDVFTAEPPPVMPDAEPGIMGDQIRGQREFTYLVRFDRTGEVTIPPIEYPVFDLDRDDYVTLATDPITVRVSSQPSEGIREITPQYSASRRPEPLEVSNSVMLDIERNGFHGSLAAPLMAFDTVLGWALIVLPLGCFVAALYFNRRRAALSSEAGFALLTRRRAARHLRRATRARQKGDSETFHAELAAAVHGHLTERLDTTTAGLSWHEVDRLLADRNVSDDLRRRLSQSLELSDFARFAPGVDGSAEMDKIHTDTIAALRDLGRELPIRRGGAR